MTLFSPAGNQKLTSSISKVQRKVDWLATQSSAALPFIISTWAFFAYHFATPIVLISKICNYSHMGEKKKENDFLGLAFQMHLAVKNPWRKVVIMNENETSLFKNHSKCPIWILKFWHFPSIFVLLKLTCLVTLFDRKLQVFKNSPKWTIFGIFN